MIHKTIRLVEAHLPPRQGEKSRIKDYDVQLSSLGTVEEVIQGILAQPENKMARGFFHIVEDESFVDFPALEDFYNMETMAFKGPKKAWHSGEMTETATRLSFMNQLRQCKSYKTKASVLKKA